MTPESFGADEPSGSAQEALSMMNGEQIACADVNQFAAPVEQEGSSIVPKHFEAPDEEVHRKNEVVSVDTVEL